jgi:hypothetical protein
MRKDGPIVLAATAPDGFALAHYFFGGTADTLGRAYVLAFGTADGFALAQLYFRGRHCRCVRMGPLD